MGGKGGRETERERQEEEAAQVEKKRRREEGKRKNNGEVRVKYFEQEQLKKYRSIEKAGGTRRSGG